MTSQPVNGIFNATCMGSVMGNLNVFNTQCITRSIGVDNMHNTNSQREINFRDLGAPFPLQQNQGAFMPTFDHAAAQADVNRPANGVWGPLVGNHVHGNLNVYNSQIVTDKVPGRTRQYGCSVSQENLGPAQPPPAHQAPLNGNPENAPHFHQQQDGQDGQQEHPGGNNLIPPQDAHEDVEID